MICNHPISHSLERLITLTEQVLDIEITIKRYKEIPYRGMLLDQYSYNTYDALILINTDYLGMLKDFIIARHCLMLLLKGSAKKSGNLKVLSYSDESVSRAMKQIYLDILKEDSGRGKKIDTPQLLKILFPLFFHFYESFTVVPWDIVINRWLFQHCEKMRKAQTYYLIKEGKRDMAKLLQFKESLPKKFIVMDKAMYYARDQYLAYFLPSDELMPIRNIPQIQKFERLDELEMSGTSWTNSSWYQTKLVGDQMMDILGGMEFVEGEGEKDAAYFNEIFNQGVAITDLWCSNLHMDTWFVWSNPKLCRDADCRKEEMEAAALKQIFGDLI